MQVFISHCEASMTLLHKKWRILIQWWCRRMIFMINGFRTYTYTHHAYIWTIWCATNAFFRFKFYWVNNNDDGVLVRPPTRLPADPTDNFVWKCSGKYLLKEKNSSSISSSFSFCEPHKIIPRTLKTTMCVVYIITDGMCSLYWIGLLDAFQHTRTQP